MFITRKELQRRIDEEVQKALICKEREMYVTKRIEGIERDLWGLRGSVDRLERRCTDETCEPKRG